MSDAAIVLTVPAGAMALLCVAVLVDKYRDYSSPLGEALRQREAKKNRYMAEFIGYGWSKGEAETRAEVRLNLEAKATESVV